MKLYTVQLTFEDFTEGIGQYQANSPERALEIFFEKSECLKDYNREELLDIMKKRIHDNNAIIQVGGNMRGVWFINTGAEFHIFLGELRAIYGGIIIQTDINAPERL